MSVTDINTKLAKAIKFFELRLAEAKTMQEERLATAGLVILGKLPCEGDNDFSIIQYFEEYAAPLHKEIQQLRTEMQRVQQHRSLYMNIASELFRIQLINEAEQIDPNLE